ncbi:hypothetical protein Pfo_024710 [Paulownia fortunei]|nr:hypothetical protein Pfo_024710 [Paulownia fortunei]
MAPLKILLLLLLDLLLNAQISQSLRTYSIGLGSSLSPTTRRSSWNSPSGRFAFGFYQQGHGFAVGIWLAGGDGVPQNTVVWTTNRDDMPVSSRATINFTNDGKLILWNELGEMKAIAEFPEAVTAASASMLDSGNFVLYDNKSTVIWESFDHPTDTMLGGQRLTVNSKLVSSASALDHTSGRFFLIMQSDENLVAYAVNRTSKSAYWASDTYVYRGSKGRSDTFLYLDHDTGILSLRYPNSTFRILTFSNSQTPDNKTRVVYRATLGPDGNFVIYSHSFGLAGDLTVEKEWSALESLCENKAYCGLNSYCTKSGVSGNCTCFPGFLPHSDPKVPDCYPGFLDEGACQGEDSALSYNMTTMENIEWGGSPYSEINMSQDDCHQNCLEDCNCWGALFDNGTCSKYKLPLISAVLNLQNSITAFVKSTSTSNPFVPSNSKIVVESKKALVLTLGLSLGSFAILCSLLAIISFILYTHRAHRYRALPGTAHQALNGEFTLRSFSYDELEKATDGFKEILDTNPCGAVYKGTLSEGNRTIAVKTLENVAEGENIFRTEMTAVGRTHHRNLVQLLGFCIEGSRKLLVYEFMNNGSLADFLFKVENRPPWKERLRGCVVGDHMLQEYGAQCPNS